MSVETQETAKATGNGLLEILGLGLYRVIALSSLGLYFPFRGPLMFICRVCIQYESFNNFENDTMKLSVNEIKLTGF